MKFPSTLFGAEGTDWIYNDFKKARRKLVGIYLLIIFCVILVFSILIILKAQIKPEGSPELSGHEITMTEERARDAFAKAYPNEVISTTEYELQDGVLYFTMEYDDQKDIKANLFTGELVSPDERPSFIVTLVDDFEEKVLWLGLLVFLLASGGSILIANRTLAPVAESIRKEKEFVSGAAHELRNPLASLQAAIESAIIRKTVDQGFLQDLLSETKRLISTSDALLSIERTERETKHIVSIPMASMIDHVLKRLDPMIKKGGLHIEKSIDEEAIRIDKRDIELILYNIFHNAIKFSPHGGTIRVSWQSPVLTISDSGPGIAPGQLPFIFDRFYKGDASRNTAGSGLGLSIVKETLSYYGADIEAKAKEGSGATFIITFKV